ncbi:(Fe-S)-binding protein [Desulfovibrio psychrotolerans]|uniref:4Fe-4S ferredoxin-type domain-containing protein n=1 Tax=Desulfovibrio psychrotolerans TaxID=415242 RepID=A0A7J0BXI1_9BACT|nr:(Fe-S)-binding protein [Desulfovibrio psychrotolerans]GFM38410.1 hypothetical protein DSM19430T_30940 [Desulfovibrio psychrotolerans]
MPDPVLHTARACTECGACVALCPFLKDHGTPKALALAHETDGPGTRSTAFLCSLCGLCTAVCPEGLDPATMLLCMRRAAVTEGELDITPYRPLLAYEQTGSSALFRHAALPDGCRTVFFPGCTLPGTRPGTTWRLYTHLCSCIPALGMVLDCCHKPSHDLGRQEYFLRRFTALCRNLREAGVETVLTACPNCHKVFSRYAEGLRVRTVYETLTGHPPQKPGDAQQNRTMKATVTAFGTASGNAPETYPVTGPVTVPATASGTEPVTVHDPCPLRTETAVHDAVRTLLLREDMRVEEMTHARGRTLCCGEGGAVSLRAPEYARRWTARRQRQAKGRTMITYCAGCARYLSCPDTKHSGEDLAAQNRSNGTAARRNDSPPVLHVLDVLFPHGNGCSKAPLRGPWTYAARLLLKLRLMFRLMFRLMS